MFSVPDRMQMLMHGRGLNFCCIFPKSSFQFYFLASGTSLSKLSLMKSSLLVDALGLSNDLYWESDDGAPQFLILRGACPGVLRKKTRFIIQKYIYLSGTPYLSFKSKSVQRKPYPFGNYHTY
ncbi:hypothetical protein BT93_J0745 [Corymbia citriodora subsp. variegata]|nr:hypothetical protein BT93_J0745 [Corymbia citriodora subsp. variegata]